MSNTKLKDKDKETVETAKTKPIIDWMPKWAKEEKCFRDAILRDVNTKKIIEGGWPRQKPVAQQAYENWLAAVINEETGQWFPERDQEGIPIKGTGARHVVTVITRVRDQSGKKEYLLSKGRLIGYDSAGLRKQYPISYPEVWHNTVFNYERNYDQKTGSFTVQTIGPSPESHDVYELPFNADNVLKLFEKVEDDNIMFVLKDLKTGDAREVKWSSVKDSLDLFMHKSWEYLWKADYIPLPVKMEYRQEAVAAGLIKGVASDFQMQSSPSTATIGVE